jgi:hypothetical protein
LMGRSWVAVIPSAHGRRALATRPVDAPLRFQ